MGIGKSASWIELESFTIMRLRGIEVAFLKIDRAQKDFRQLMVGNQGLYTGKYVARRLKILGIAIDDARLKEKCDFLVRGSDRPPGCHVQLLCALPASWMFRIAAMAASCRPFRTAEAVSKARCSKFICFCSSRNCIESLINPV